ncbi:MAG: hypothetical protein JXR41_01010 [Bacteroidales bacterium]|nr:hypothetical protein [Bacteroidales bacterium]MBN2761639.1 hypothetical protein [Bacteroidales bacterium]
MKRLAGVLAFVAIFQVVTLGQDCNMYLPETENTQLEYKSFDKKNKLTGSVVQKVSGITREAGSVNATIEAEYFDNKGKSQGKSELKARCENGIFYLDMRNFLNQESMEGFKDMEMQLEGGFLEMPSKLNVGDVLKPGDMKIVFSTEDTPVMTMTINITNRKVEAYEDVTTDAGTFKCYKISYDINTRMMFSIKAKAIEYYNEDVGMLKSESYTTAGALQGYTVLSAIKK